MKNWFLKKQIGKEIDYKREINKDSFIEKESNKFKKGYKRVSKRGSTVITDMFILVVSLLIITITTMFMVNILTPFIYYQKLQMTSQKYMYIIEKYGGLTSLEISQMYDELESNGFQKDKIEINIPEDSLSYGDEIIFEIKYTHTQKVPTLDGGINMKDKDIELVIRKVSIVKK